MKKIYFTIFLILILIVSIFLLFNMNHKSQDINNNNNKNIEISSNLSYDNFINPDTVPKDNEYNIDDLDIILETNNIIIYDYPDGSIGFDTNEVIIPLIVKAKNDINLSFKNFMYSYKNTYYYANKNIAIKNTNLKKEEVMYLSISFTINENFDSIFYLEDFNQYELKGKTITYSKQMFNSLQSNVSEECVDNECSSSFESNRV